MITFGTRHLRTVIVGKFKNKKGFHDNTITIRMNLIFNFTAQFLLNESPLKEVKLSKLFSTFVHVIFSDCHFLYKLGFVHEADHDITLITNKFLFIADLLLKKI